MSSALVAGRIAPARIPRRDSNSPTAASAEQTREIQPEPPTDTTWCPDGWVEMACLPTTSPLLVGSMYGAANLREWCLATLIVVFRGIGQVVFMNSPLAGALIFAGLVVQSPFTAFCGLWATLSATVTAWFWYFPTSRLESGLYGYSACLTGIAMATFSPLMRWPAFRFFTASIVPDDSFSASSPPTTFTLSDRDASLLLLALIFAVAVFGVAAAFVQEALINTLRRHFKLPTFTLAFNLVTVLYFFGSFSFKFVPSDIVPPIHSLAAPPPFTVDAHAAFSAGRFLQGAFLGVGQVFFASHWLTSLLVLAGMCVCSRPLAAAALFGSVIGACVGAAVGADLNDLYFGLYGFNSVLASVAMYALMNVQTRVRLLLLATAAATGAALCFAAAKTFMRYWSVSAFTFPFCLTALVFTAMQPTFDEAARRLRRDTHEAQKAAAADRKRARRSRIEEAGAAQSSENRRNGEFTAVAVAREAGDAADDSPYAGGAAHVPDAIPSAESSLPLSRLGWTPNPILGATRPAEPASQRSDSREWAFELNHCVLELAQNAVPETP